MSAAFLLALCLLTRATSAAEALTPAEARARLEAGDKDALAGLRAWVEANPDDVEGHLLLAQTLVDRGEWDAALEVARARGARPGGEALVVKAAEIHRLRAGSGPHVTRAGNRVIPRSTDGSVDAAAWKKQEWEEVIRLIQSVWDYPFPDPKPLLLVPSAQSSLGRRDETLASLYQIRARFPADPDVQLSICTLEKAAHPGDTAIAACKQAVDMAPQNYLAHQRTVEALRAAGRAEEAQYYQRNWELYAYLNPFGVPYSEKRWKQVNALRSSNSDNPPWSEPPETSPARALASLQRDPSAEATTIMVAFVFDSYCDDELHEAAWDTLMKRPGLAAELLVDTIDESQSGCLTDRATLLIATHRPPGAFEVLASMLPKERTSPVPMDIAKKLAMLGDPRAVPLLVAEVERAPNPDEPVPDMYAERARVSAAVALGAFDTPESRATLDACQHDPRIGAYCQAALYRLNGGAAAP